MSAAVLLRRDRALTAIAVALDVAFHAGRGGGALAGAAEVADRLGVARRGLEPVLQSLSRAGLLDSVRGPRGGYRLARPLHEIAVAEAITAIDGPIALTACVEGSGCGCEATASCPVHGKWAPVNDAVRAALGAITSQHYSAARDSAEYIAARIAAPPP